MVSAACACLERGTVLAAALLGALLCAGPLGAQTVPPSRRKPSLPPPPAPEAAPVSPPEAAPRDGCGARRGSRRALGRGHKPFAAHHQCLAALHPAA